MKSLNRKLFAVTIGSVALCIFSFLPIVSRRTAPQWKKSALLNPAYREMADEIELQQENAVITIKKMPATGTGKPELWTVSEGSLCMLADEKLVDGLLDSLIKVRKLYTKIYSTDKGVSRRPVQASLFVKNSVKMYTKLDFFNPNSLTNRIVLRGGAAQEYFEIDDDVSQFLQTSVRFWEKSELIQTISEPIYCFFEEKGQNSAFFSEKSDDFTKKVHDVSVLRHGDVHPTVDVSSLNPTATLVVSNAEGQREEIAFYPLDGGSYRCAYRFSNPLFSERLRFDAEISGWTYDRLKAIFAR